MKTAVALIALSTLLLGVPGIRAAEEEPGKLLPDVVGAEKLIPLLVDAREVSTQIGDAIGAQIFLFRFYLAMAERDYAEVGRVIETWPQLSHGEELLPQSYFAALLARVAEDSETSRPKLIAARKEIQAMLDSTPNVNFLISSQAKIDAALGHREEALHEIARALELSPATLERGEALTDETLVYVWLGDRDQAREKLEKLVNVPHAISYGDLRFQPDWDSVRNEPWFSQVMTRAQEPIDLR